jgi:hypothetical protein
MSVCCSDMDTAAEEAAAACDAALESMPATVDFAFVFLANMQAQHEEAMQAVLGCIARRLPPGALPSAGDPLQGPLVLLCCLYVL